MGYCLLCLKTPTQKWQFYKGNGQNHEVFLQGTVDFLEMPEIENDLFCHHCSHSDFKELRISLKCLEIQVR